MTDKPGASLWDNSLKEFRDRVAAASATPGGGAVAAVAATFAAALLQMVCAISARRQPNEGINAIAQKIKASEETLARCAEEDIRVFNRYMTARKANAGTSKAEIQLCLLACTDVPLEAAEEVAKLEACAVEIAVYCLEYLASDLATSRYLLQASRKALLENITVNLAEMEDGEAKRLALRRLHGFQVDATAAG